MKERDTAKPSDLVSTDVLLRYQDCNTPSSYALPALKDFAYSGHEPPVPQVIHLKCWNLAPFKQCEAQS